MQLSFIRVLICFFCVWLGAPLAAYAGCVPGSTTSAETLKQLKLRVDFGEARVGEPVRLSWSLPEKAKPRQERAYLILLTPDAVRFDGAGFFALAAAAPNPTGVKYGASRTRAIIPLHTAFSENSGEISVLPFAAGPLALEWAVVGVADCGEWIASQGRSEMAAIGAGGVTIVLRDEFSDAKPDKIIRALRGPYRVHAFKDRFEVYDDASGALILRRQGREPVFSPTGRFLIAATSRPGIYEVTDLLAARVIGLYEANTLAWSHADSFLFYEDRTAGKMQIVRALIGKRHDLATVVKTRRELKIEARGPGASLDEEPEDRQPRAPGIDVEPEGTTCARECFAREQWQLDLSIDHGMATFFDAFHEDAALRVLAYDLGALQKNALFTNDAAGRAAFQERFHIAMPKFDGWRIGDKLKTTTRADAETDGEAQRHRTGRMIQTPDSTPANRERNVAKRGAVIPRDPAAFSAAASKQIIGARLAHLPVELLTGLRAGRDNLALAGMEKTIAPLYPPEIAKRGPAGSERDYFTAPFPDPHAAAPKEPVVLDLIAEGRDVWAFAANGAQYWLTQTVSSNHLWHRFSFSLLERGKGGKLRHVSLIGLANDPEGKRPPATRGSDDADATDADEERDAGPFTQFVLGDRRTALGSAFGEPSVASLSGNRYLAIMTKPVPRLIVLDLQTWRLACGTPYPVDGADAAAVVMHASGEHATQINSNGAIHVYACRSGENVLNGAYVDDELVVMDRNGYFDGSEDVAGYVEVAIAGLPGRHLLAQFARSLYRPGIAADALAGGALPAPKFGAPPAMRLAAGGKGGDVRLEAFSPLGLEAVQIYADGRLFRRTAAEGANQSVPLTAAERRSFRSITAIAVDKAGLVSAPLALSGLARSDEARGRLFMLSVGVDRYPLVPPVCGDDQRQSCDLEFAVADANRVAAAVGRSRLYEGISSSALGDERASQPAILAEIDRIVAAAQPQDTVAMFFAGHGLIDDAGGLRLALASTQIDRIAETGLSFEAIAERLRLSKARVIMLLDVCHAGLAERASVATNDALVDRLVTRSGASMIVLSASKGRQFSEEAGDEQGGRFSVAIANVLARDRAIHDNDRNGAISIAELFKGVKSQVAAASAGRQTPWLSRNLIVGDFDAF
jgi:hypothetical protein